jgi:hypothetical protein
VSRLSSDWEQGGSGASGKLSECGPADAQQIAGKVAEARTKIDRPKCMILLP